MPVYISLLSCFLALIMMVYHWKVNRNTIFLGLLIFFLASYAITGYVLVNDQSRFWMAIFYAHPAPFWYLPGPLLYLYARGTLEDRFRIQPLDLLHLVPFLISLVGLFPYLISPFEEKLKLADAIIKDLQAPRYIQTNWLLSFEANLLLRPLLMIVYSVVCIIMVARAEKIFSYSPSIPKSQWEFSRKWLLLLSTILIIISIPSLLLSIYYNSDYSVNRIDIRNSFISETVGYTLLLLPVILIIFPQILYGIPRVRNKTGANPDDTEIEKNNNIKAFVPEIEAPANYAKDSKLEADPFYELGERVLAMMRDEKPYLDFDFSLDDLANKLEVPKHHLYYCFQNVLHTKFTRLRTEYRIEHAKNLLAEADLRKITLDSIGRDSGFASKSGFYNTFKAEVGCSPGEYAQLNNPFGSSFNV